MNWKEREYERGNKEINYSQSAALLHVFCPFAVVKGVHGGKLPAGAALGKKGRIWGSVGDGLGGGALLPMTGCSQAPMIPISNSYSPRTQLLYLGGEGVGVWSPDSLFQLQFCNCD